MDILDYSRAMEERNLFRGDYTKINDIKLNNYPIRQIEVHLRTIACKYLVTQDN